MTALIIAAITSFTGTPAAKVSGIKIGMAIICITQHPPVANVVKPTRMKAAAGRSHPGTDVPTEPISRSKSPSC